MLRARPPGDEPQSEQFHPARPPGDEPPGSKNEALRAAGGAGAYRHHMCLTESRSTERKSYKRGKIINRA